MNHNLFYEGGISRFSHNNVRTPGTRIEYASFPKSCITMLLTYTFGEPPCPPYPPIFTPYDIVLINDIFVMCGVEGGRSPTETPQTVSLIFHALNKL